MMSSANSPDSMGFSVAKDTFNNDQLVHDKMNINVVRNQIDHQTSVTVETKYTPQLEGGVPREIKITLTFGGTKISNETIKNAIMKELFRESVVNTSIGHYEVSKDGKMSRMEVHGNQVESHTNVVSKQGFFKKLFFGSMKGAFQNFSVNYTRMKTFTLDGYAQNQSAVLNQQFPSYTQWKAQEEGGKPTPSEVLNMPQQPIEESEEGDAISEVSTAETDMEATTEEYPSDMEELSREELMFATEQKIEVELPAPRRIREVEVEPNTPSLSLSTSETTRKWLEGAEERPRRKMNHTPRNRAVTILTSTELIKLVKQDAQTIRSLLHQSKAAVKNENDREKIVKHKEILRTATTKLANELKVLRSKYSPDDEQKMLSFERFQARVEEIQKQADLEFQRLTNIENR